jgi:peroxiredoxin
MSQPVATPQWMKSVLLAAGIYNLAWGAFAVIFPNAIFTWLGMDLPNYPQLWQCIGMIVGVYGLGYIIAAFDPVKHWPIILVGFLGKVFGPLGMAQALWTGQLPWGFALNCLTNDLIWWVPFALILRHAWLAFSNDEGHGALPDEATLIAEAKTTEGTSLRQLSQARPTLVVFLRHSGCTFCREAMADIAARREQIEKNGMAIALVHMGRPEEFSRFARSYGLESVPAFPDPERRLYRGLGLRRGTIAQLLGLQVWIRGARAFFSGHRVGLLAGDGAQMPGAFVIRDGVVIKRFHHKSAADRPDYVEFCSL